MRYFRSYFVYKFPLYFVFGLETFCVLCVLPLLYFVFSCLVEFYFVFNSRRVLLRVRHRRLCQLRVNFPYKFNSNGP